MQVRQAALCGARFALSPINPPGFIDACKLYGLVAVPGCATPNEIWAAHQQGAQMIKVNHIDSILLICIDDVIICQVFPAPQWSPALLTSLKEVGQSEFYIHILYTV